MKNLGKIVCLFSLLILTTIDCSNKDKTNKQKEPKHKSILKIEMKYENMFTTTFISVSCVKFESTFSKIIKEKTLDSKDRFLFEKLFNQTLSNNNQKNSIDTRVKIKIYYNDDSNKEICIGLHTLEFDGIIYSITKEFTDYLLKITETE